MAKSHDPLPPGVERRLAAWISVKDGPKGAEAPRPGPTITISRKYGCEAFLLAARVKRLPEAAEVLREYRQKGDAFIESQLRASIRDVAHYHAVFNRDRSGLEEIATGI